MTDLDKALEKCEYKEGCKVCHMIGWLGDHCEILISNEPDGWEIEAIPSERIRGFVLRKSGLLEALTAAVIEVGRDKR